MRIVPEPQNGSKMNFELLLLLFVLARLLLSEAPSARFSIVCASFGGSMPMRASRNGLSKSRAEYASMFWMVIDLAMYKRLPRMIEMSMPFWIALLLYIWAGDGFIHGLFTNLQFSSKDLRIFLEKFKKSLRKNLELPCILIAEMANGILPELSFKFSLSKFSTDARISDSFESLFSVSVISAILIVPPRRF